MPLADSGDDPSVISDPVDPGFFPGDETGDDDEIAFAQLEAEMAEATALQSNGDASSAGNAPLGTTNTEGVESDGAGRKDPVADLEFDQRYRDDFDGLLYLGSLTHTFRFAGHSFTIHTLSIDELLRVSLLVKEWEGTLGQNRAYLTAMAAASIDIVDDRPIYTPMGPNDDEVTGRFRYVKDHWYPWIADSVYENLMALEARVTEILSAMGEAGG